VKWGYKILAGNKIYNIWLAILVGRQRITNFVLSTGNELFLGFLEAVNQTFRKTIKTNHYHEQLPTLY